MKRAIVTGGTGGIGTAIVRELVENKFNVIVTHRNKDEDFLNTWMNSNNLSSSVIQFLNCDITNEEQVNLAFNNLNDIDLLVNNAGITGDSTFIKMDKDKWEKVINTNLISLFLISQIIARKMVDRGKGSIINISSINALKGQFGQTNYSASKAGIIGFTKSLSQELASKGVQVNAIAPGYTNTSMIQAVPDKIKEQIKSNIPTKEFVQPEEIAKVVVFLAAGIKSLTGETISVNGGQYMH
jgi:acetoacetyl-CoA reductase